MTGLAVLLLALHIELRVLSCRGAIMIAVCLPYILISTIVFIRARAASYYFVDNLTA